LGAQEVVEMLLEPLLQQLVFQVLQTQVEVAAVAVVLMQFPEQAVQVALAS
jgi:hypothetical protein